MIIVGRNEAVAASTEEHQQQQQQQQLQEHADHPTDNRDEQHNHYHPADDSSSSVPKYGVTTISPPPAQPASWDAEMLRPTSSSSSTNTAYWSHEQQAIFWNEQQQRFSSYDPRSSDASSCCTASSSKEGGDSRAAPDETEGLPLMLIRRPNHPSAEESFLNNNRSHPQDFHHSSNITEGGEVEFLAAVRFCVSIGKAAFRYGSPGSKVEPFLQRLLEDRFGYHQGMFRATQAELMCSVTQGPDDVPRTFLVALEPGLNLHKLGLLADLVDRVVGTASTSPAPNHIPPITSAATTVDESSFSVQEEPIPQPPTRHLVSRVEAIAQLKEIESAPDPWGPGAVFTSFPIVGGGLAMVLGGSWWDVLVGSLLGIICYATMECLPKLGTRGRSGRNTHLHDHKRFAQWIPLVASFGTSTMATIVKRTLIPELHVTLVTLSSIAILLPGYSVSMGIEELVANRIISGFANLVGGMVTMFWLVLGAWLGDAFGRTVTGTSGHEFDDDDDDSIVSATAGQTNLLEVNNNNSVSMVWQALFIPLLCFSLIAAFQVSRRDVVWCFLHLILTYLIFLVTGVILEQTHDGTDDAAASSILAAGGTNLRTYLSTLVSCVAANTWARSTNRPHSILLVPALVFLVSGSIGFQGLLTIFLEEGEDDKSTGKEQFLQMIIVALLIVAGLLTGNTLLEPSTTL